MDCLKGDCDDWESDDRAVLAEEFEADIQMDKLDEELK